MVSATIVILGFVSALFMAQAFDARTDTGGNIYAAIGITFFIIAILLLFI